MSLIGTLLRMWSSQKFQVTGRAPLEDSAPDDVPAPVPYAIHYLETSGVNALADGLGVSDWNLLAQCACRFEMCVSPVVLWEAFLNSDVSRRDHLVHWMQFSCANRLLKSPVEIVIDFIERGTPRKERALFATDPYTKTAVGDTWTSIHGKLDRTFQFDAEKLRDFSKAFQDFSKVYPMSTRRRQIGGLMRRSCTRSW